MNLNPPLISAQIPMNDATAKSCLTAESAEVAQRFAHDHQTQQHNARIINETATGICEKLYIVSASTRKRPASGDMSPLAGPSCSTTPFVVSALAPLRVHDP